MNYRVLDISAYQGEVDFAKGKSDGIWGVMLKATEGERYLSPAFDKNYQKATDSGLYVGAYHYLRASTPAEALKEAQFFLQKVAGKKLTLPLAVDIEAPEQQPIADLAPIAKAFCDEVERNKYYAMIYSTVNWFQTSSLRASWTSLTAGLRRWASISRLSISPTACGSTPGTRRSTASPDGWMRTSATRIIPPSSATPGSTIWSRNRSRRFPRSSPLSSSNRWAIPVFSSKKIVDKKGKEGERMSVSIRHTVSPTMTEEEQKLLRSIGAVRRYPVCRFELRSSKDRELCSVALDAVHLQDASEQIEPVKERVTLLKSLEQKGMIVLYYGLTTYVKSDYQIFHDSAVFHQLQELGRGGRQTGGLPV